VHQHRDGVAAVPPDRQRLQQRQPVAPVDAQLVIARGECHPWSGQVTTDDRLEVAVPDPGVRNESGYVDAP
jgi:hypothetical protein